jgi:hypothetical protein
MWFVRRFRAEIEEGGVALFLFVLSCWVGYLVGLSMALDP